MTPLLAFSILEFCIIVALILGCVWQERKAKQMRDDWNEDLIDLGIAWRYHIKSTGGDWNVYVKSRRRFYEQFKQSSRQPPV